MTKLTKNADRFKGNKLNSVLTSLVTKLKKKERTLKTTVSVQALGIKLSNEVFNDGAPDGHLSLLPLPYTFTRRIKTLKDGTVVKGDLTEVLCVWRAYIDGTLEDVDEDNQTNNKADALLEELMGECTI